jgi:predicted transposase/invertase (TIGR01784 family)
LAHLPLPLLLAVDLDSLEQKPGSYIDDTCKESIVDVLFKTKIQEHDAFLYLIIEHQSRPDPLMPFRVWRYQCNIIEKHLKETKEKRIPLVIPLVIYHGHTPWTYPTGLHDIVDAPEELVDRYFLKPFQLIDLNAIPDEALKAHIWSGAMALTLKHIFDQDILPHLPQILDLLSVAYQKDGSVFTENVLRYILDRGKNIDTEKLVQLVTEKLSDDVGEKIMTFAQRHEEKGRLRGLKEGREEGLEQVAIKLLKLSMDPEFIAQCTDLSLEKIHALQARLKA